MSAESYRAHVLAWQRRPYIPNTKLRGVRNVSPRINGAHAFFRVPSYYRNIILWVETLIFVSSVRAISILVNYLLIYYFNDHHRVFWVHISLRHCWICKKLQNHSMLIAQFSHVNKYSNLEPLKKVISPRNLREFFINFPRRMIFFFLVINEKKSFVIGQHENSRSSIFKAQEKSVARTKFKTFFSVNLRSTIFIRVWKQRSEHCIFKKIYCFIFIYIYPFVRTYGWIYIHTSSLVELVWNE